MRYFLLIFIALPLFCDILPSDPDAILHFADKLSEYSEHRRAATEYLRYYSLYSDRPNANKVLFKAALSLEENSEFTNARNFYNILEKQTSSDMSKSVISFRKANTYYAENKIDSCLAYINSKDKEMSMLYLKGFALLHKQEFYEAGKVFSELSTVGGDLSPSFLYMLSKSRQGINYKSPITAGLLSTFVPGLGKGYTGQWGDAVFSFLTVSATVGPAIYFAEEDKTFSILTGLLGAFFYLGNIYVSANGAVNYNNKSFHDFLRDVEKGVPHPPKDINRNLP